MIADILSQHQSLAAPFGDSLAGGFDIVAPQPEQGERILTHMAVEKGQTR
jgi:hypothetical protein